MNYFVFETKDGPRLVRANNLRAARRHVKESVLTDYISDERKATTDDMAELAQRAGGLVIEDAEMPQKHYLERSGADGEAA